MDEQELMRIARKRTDMKMGFLVHLLVFTLVNGGLYVIGLMHGRELHYLPFWGWTLGLCIHGVVTLCGLVGGGLRERMMQGEIERLRRRGG